MIDESKIVVVDMVKALGDRRSFVSGDSDAERIRIQFFKRLDTQGLGAKITFGQKTEGAPGLVHGGCIAAVLEETMRFAAWAAGNAVFSVRLATNFKQMLPLGSNTYADTAVEALDAAKLRVTSQLYAENDAPVADAEALFLIVPSDKFGVNAETIKAMFSALQ